MGNRFEKRKEVWRDKDGFIECPGDACPKECDEDCPIYLNTEAAALLMLNQYEKAIELYKKALAIAPDFYDALNNMGSCYGSLGDYKKSYDYYLKAHECDKQKPKPIYGLALSAKDLGKYEECISWCNQYDLISNDRRCDVIRSVVNAKLNHFESRDKPRF